MHTSQNAYPNYIIVDGWQRTTVLMSKFGTGKV